MLILHSAPAKRAKMAVSVGGGSNYTATHYVAPFASVSGASSDDDAQNGTAFTNASNSGTPCTLACAMANATAGNQVQCAAGVYVTAYDGAVAYPGWEPTNSGTSGNEIVFFAATPAATNRGSSASFTELRFDQSGLGYDTGQSILGCSATGPDYIIFDGFFVSRTYAPPIGSKGALVNGQTGVQFRRIYYDYVSSTPAIGGQTDNWNAIWMAGSLDCVIQDCYFENNGGGTAHHNFACIGAYGARNFKVLNCEFNNFVNGIFLKDVSVAGYGNYGEIAYNKFTDGGLTCMTIQHTEPGQTALVHHNLAIASGGIDFDGSGAAGDRDFTIYNNTFAGGASGFTALNLYDGLIGWTRAGSYYNNLHVDNNSGLSYMWYSDSSQVFGTLFEDVTVLDNNCYYDANAACVFYDTGNRTFAQYRTALGSMPVGAREAGSFESTVTFTGSGDYTLASNGQDALTASDVGGPVGCYVTGSEVIGIRSSPVY